MSLDNTTMMEVYPYGGILAYLKYHLIDGVMKQMVLMIDKTRVNYDKGAKVKIATDVKTEEEIGEILAGFGIGENKE